MFYLAALDVLNWFVFVSRALHKDINVDMLILTKFTKLSHDRTIPRSSTLWGELLEKRIAQ